MCSGGGRKMIFYREGYTQIKPFKLNNKKVLRCCNNCGTDFKIVHIITETTDRLFAVCSKCDCKHILTEECVPVARGGNK
jgi:hypothetical protein